MPHRPKLRLYHAAVDEIIGHFRMHARLWVPAPLPLSLPDPDDEPFLAAALAAGCHLVTGNLRHYPKASRSGAAVVTPREFMEWLGRGSAG